MCKRNILVIIDKIVSLTRKFSKALVILAWFFVLFLLLLLLIVYISFHSILKFFEVRFFASLLYKYMKIWYFHGQYITNGSGNNEISYNIFDLRHMSKLAAKFEKKNKIVYIFAQVSKQRKWKNIKERGCRAAFRTLPNTYDGAFLRKYNG